MTQTDTDQAHPSLDPHTGARTSHTGTNKPKLLPFIGDDRPFDLQLGCAISVGVWSSLTLIRKAWTRTPGQGPATQEQSNQTSTFRWR